MQIVNRRIISQAFVLLPSGTKQKLLLLIVFQGFTSIMDLAALYLLGTLASVGISYIQNQSVMFPTQITRLLNLENFAFETQFAFVSFLIISIFIFRTSLAIVGNFRILKFLGNRAASASASMVSKLLASKPDYILRKKSQELLYSVTTGIDILILSYISSASILLTEALFLVVLVSGVFAFSPSAGLLTLLVFGISSILISRLTSNRGRSLAEKSSRLGVTYNEKLLEILSVYRELLLRGQLGKASSEVQRVRTLILRIRAQLMFLPILSKYLFEFSIIVGGSVVGFSQILLQDSKSAIASIVIFVAASTRILPSLIRAQNSFLTMRQSEGGAQVTLDVIEEIDNLFDKFDENALKASTSEFVPLIQVDGLTFSYPDSNDVVLNDVNLSIKAGQFVAIVGQSGSGKSTLVDLLLGMLKPISGSVKISGVSSREAIKAWPGLIAYVPQDIGIIDGSIAKNVVLQDANQQESQILESLNRSHLLDDVLSMEKKLEEVVGEKGTRLSGGQKQRLGIARALYTRPQMIVFDEATSSLDPITEKSVTDSIYSKKGKVTLIVIAHRLSTVRNADLVILLDQGRVVAQGTFEEVRAKAPKFDEQAKLVNL